LLGWDFRRSRRAARNSALPRPKNLHMNVQPG
jgi:hypothetical protein